MNNMKTVCLTLGLLFAIQQLASCYEIKDCASSRNPDAKLISLDVDSCPDNTVARCTFHKGSNATLQVKFKPTKSFTQANVGIWGKWGPIYIPFRLQGPTDACGNYGFNCPVTVGDEETFKISLPVLAQYPSISVSVRFELNDQAKMPIVCFEIPVTLENPPPSPPQKSRELAEDQEQEEASDS